MATLNLQVAASTDDGHYAISPDSYYDATAVNCLVGEVGTTYGSWHRFTGVSGLAGATINAAALSVWGRAADIGTPITKIRAERANAPAAPTTQADAEGRTKTTAKVDWDDPNLSTVGYVSSPSLVSVIQELADNHDPSAILIFWEDDGGGGTNYAQTTAYNDNPARTAKLTITYTASTTHEAAAALSVTATLSPTAGLLLTPGAALAAAATLSPLATGEVLAAAALPGTGALSADGNIGVLLAASSLVGSATLAALAAPLVKNAAAALSASALLTARATRVGPIKTVSLGAGFTSSLRQHGGLPT